MNNTETDTPAGEDAPADSPRRHTLFACFFLMLLAITVLRPLASSEFWWHSARGAAVLDGNLCPSRVLLANETANDADWLGGLVSLVAWELGGEWGVSLYPVVLLLVSLVIFRNSSDGRQLDSVVVFGCLLSLFSYAWMQPVPQSLELLLLIGMFPLLTRDPQEPEADVTKLCLLLFLWANIGAHVLIGYTLAGLFVLASGRSRNDKLKYLLLATLAVCITPRGLFTLWDSLHLVCPWLFSSDENTLLIHWTSADGHSTSLLPLAFLLLAVIPISLGLRRRLLTGDYTACLLLVSAAVMNPQLIGISAAGIGLTLFRSLRTQATQTRYSVAAFVLACLFFFHLAAQTPFGVAGLDPRLDQRLLQDGLPETMESEVAWCDSTLAGGMYCYVSGEGRCWDVPIRAGICGRTHEISLFRRDLLRDRESRYRRPDGSWGGWWVTAKDRGIEILLVEAEDTALHESLQPTEWKPTDLDSPVIPYVKASNAAHQPELIRCLEAQDIVSFTDWSFDFQQFSATQPYVALNAASAELLAKSAALRQARLFDSLGLHIASLKTLYALRSNFGSAEFEADVRSAHQGLAFREWREVGHNSLFHQWIGRGQHAPEVEHDAGLFDEAFAAGYLAGNLEELLLRPATTAQEHFAQALIAFEAGNLSQAMRSWQAAIEVGDDPEIERLSKHWLTLFEAGSDE